MKLHSPSDISDNLYLTSLYLIDCEASTLPSSWRIREWRTGGLRQGVECTGLQGLAVTNHPLLRLGQGNLRSPLTARQC